MGSPRASSKEGTMIEVLETIERWRGEGQRIAVATVVAVEQSAPRGPGAVMTVNERGDVAGSVSGGCVESAVYEEAQDAIATGRPRLVTYGISDADAISVGLTCGGANQGVVDARCTGLCGEAAPTPALPPAGPAGDAPRRRPRRREAAGVRGRDVRRSRHA